MRERTAGIDYITKDYEGFRVEMLKELQIKMPEYTDLRQSDAGVVIIELLAQGLDILSFYQDSIANEVFLTTAQQRENALKWSSILGYVPRTATPSTFVQVFKLISEQTNIVTIPKGTKVKTDETVSENAITFETDKDINIPVGALGDEQDIDGNYLYSTTVTQGISVTNEVVGSSIGTKDQSFTLKYSPVIIDSIQVLVNEGIGFEKWDKVDNFVESTPTSKHYTVTVSDLDYITITFGDGNFGKIPESYSNGIYSSYRVGGGTVGNVGANTITKLDNSIAVLDSTFNPFSALIYGEDKETLEEIKVNAPLYNRTKWGALTLEDFTGVLMSNFPIIQFATAEVDTTNIDNIIIYVMLVDNEPLSQELLDEIAYFFDENIGGRKIVGCNEVIIEPPILTSLDFTCNLIVEAEYEKNLISTKVEDFFIEYFREGSYPFQKELSISSLSTDLLNSEIYGIKSFKILNPTEEILTPLVNEIYTLGELTLNITGGI